MSGSAVFAIVPVKALGRAKRRLSAMLPDAIRQRLVLTMLEDVLAAVGRVESVETTLVVTADPFVASLVRERGATVVPESGPEELNAAIVGGVAYARARGAAQTLVLPADVPLSTPDELAALIHSRGGQPGVTLAPAHDGGGTNGLLLAPPGAIAPCFGPGSYLQHLSQAMARRVDVNVVHLAGIARDIDEPTDIIRLLDDAGAGARYAFLAPHVAAYAGPEPQRQGNDQ